MKKLVFVPMLLAFLTVFSTNVFASDAVSNQTALYLIEESNKAMGDVQSFSMDVNADVNVGMNFEGAPGDMQMTMFMDMVFDVANGFYVTYDITSPVEPMSVKMEMYADREVVAIRMPGLMDDWQVTEADPSFSASLDLANSITESDLADLQFDSINSTYSYNRNAMLNGQEYYVVSSVLNADDFMSFFEEINASMSLFTEEDLAMLNQVFAMVSGDIKMDTYINKATMVSDCFAVSMDMVITDPMSSENITVQVEMTGEMGDFNSAVLPVLDLPAPGEGPSIFDEELALEEALTEEAPVEENTAEEVPTEEVPVEEAPVEEVPAA